MLAVRFLHSFHVCVCMSFHLTAHAQNHMVANVTVIKMVDSIHHNNVFLT